MLLQESSPTSHPQQPTPHTAVCSPARCSPTPRWCQIPQASYKLEFLPPSLGSTALPDQLTELRKAFLLTGLSQSMFSKATGTGWRELSQRLKTLAALAQDPGAVSTTHVVPHNCL